MVFFVHLVATLDNWDPRIIDPIAARRHVVAFDNRGVGASTGRVPDSVEGMADDAVFAEVRAAMPPLRKPVTLDGPHVATSPRHCSTRV